MPVVQWARPPGRVPVAIPWYQAVRPITLNRHHSSITTIMILALSLSSSLLLKAHLGTFVLFALERFFRLALMVLDFGRVINPT